MSTALVYPQLGTGAIGQFPVERKRKLRTVVNRSADGHVVTLADPAGAVTEWNLQYAGLTDAELATLEAFFAAAEGTLNSFTFVDPVGNLLAWSAQFSNEVWVKGPQLTVSGQQITNAGAGAQSITQTLAAPSGYLYCLSAQVKAAAATTVTMMIGNQSAARAVGTDWSTIVFAASGDPTFGLELAAGAAVDVAWMQAEPQASPSVYQASTTGGVYENARLGDDSLAITTTDVNCHSCTVKVIHAEHL